MIAIKIKPLSPTAVVPRWTEGNSGADLHAPYADDVYPGQTVKLNLGFAIELPPRHEAQIRPRSGLSLRGFVVVTGTVDASYRGELAAILHNQSRDDVWRIKQGDRVAQLVIQAVPYVAKVDVVSALSESDRGAKGFGSSGL